MIFEVGMEFGNMGLVVVKVECKVVKCYGEEEWGCLVFCLVYG